MSLKNSKVKLLDSKPRICFFTQTAFGTSFTHLTSGVFLSGLAILMGAGDVLVSYLSVILNICGVMMLAFSTLLGRFKSRKRLTIVLTALSRITTLFIVAIPAAFPKEAQLPIFIIVIVIAFTLQAQTTVSLNQWMLGFIDEKTKGRYISLRQTLTLIVTVLLSIVGGYWMDYMKIRAEYLGFTILFSFAAVMSAAEIILLMCTPDSIAYRPEQKFKFLDIIKLPFKNRKFLGFVVYIVIFYLILYISDSFTTVYMIRYLELPYSTITLLSLILSLPQVVILYIWGKISDKRGSNFVLKTSIWLFMGETFFMFFAGPQTWYIFIPIAFTISSAANAGFSISVFNRRYELMPQENRIVFDNFYTAAIGIGFIIGPLIGGAFKSLFESSPTISNSMPLASIRLLYMIATIGILILQIVSLIVKRKKNKDLFIQSH